MSTLERALEIAREAHVVQVDRAGRPYIEHVMRVVDAVGDRDAKIVAALHDVLEDRPDIWTAERLRREGFDESIVLDVVILTKPPKVGYQGYILSVAAQGSARAKAIKVADLQDNSDPARLAALPEPDRIRLSQKYSKALAQLGAAP